MPGTYTKLVHYYYDIDSCVNYSHFAKVSAIHV